MEPAVRIERGYYLIDTDAWVDQRVGDPADDFTALLREFTDHDLFRDQPTRMDVSSRVLLWCAARGWPVSEGAPIDHDDERLTRPVSVVLATAPGPTSQAVAIVIVEHGQPVVYPDLTTDDGYWYATATVDLFCPTGHRLTWDGGRGLVDHEGQDTTIAAVFGTDRQAPFRSCRACAAFADADADADADTDTDLSCGCGGWAIYCPVCGARCRLDLPAIPTHQRPRLETS
jgi:hypothetical protein